MRSLARKVNLMKGPTTAPNTPEVVHPGLYLSDEQVKVFLGKHTVNVGDEIEVTLKMEVSEVSKWDRLELSALGVADGPYLLKTRKQKNNPLPSK
jgi:hypothetical protein